VIEAPARTPGLDRIQAALRERTPASAAVGVLLLAAVVARILISRHILAPWVMEDELQYAEFAKSFAHGGHYLFRGEPYPARTIYPALISPAWLAHSMATTYALAKAINVLLMTAAAIPLYVWARRLVSPLWSLAAVVLFLAIPSFAYTGEILTENAYLPAVMLALFALAVALERPTLSRQALALLFAAIVVAVRIQGLVFVAIIPTAILLKLLFDAVAAAPRERRPLVRATARRWWPTLATLGLTALGYALYKASQNASYSSGLGVYAHLTQLHYSVRKVPLWIIYHFAELALSCGVIPFSALIVLFGLACRRATSPEPAERAFLAATSAAIFWTVAEVGIFASAFAFRIEERYLFNLIPALVLALVVWLDRGLPRPPALTAAAALVPAALLLALPYTSFFNGSLFNDTFGLIPIWRLTTLLGGTAEPQALVGLGMLVAGLLFASLPRRAALWAVPAAMLAFFVLSSKSVVSATEWQSAATRYAGGLQGDPSWIDHAIGRDERVEFLYTTDIDRDQHILWQDEFWNRSVRRVFGVTSQDPSIPDVTAPLDAATGRIKPALPADSPDLKPRYVVAAANVPVVGKRIAAAGFLALYRVQPPLGLASLTTGIEPDAWTGSSATYTNYRPSHARRIVLVVWRPKQKGPPPAHVTVEIGSVRAVNQTAELGRIWATQRFTVKNGTRHVFRLPLHDGPFQVRLSVSPTFVPSQYGLADTRTLGVQVLIGQH
jgi:hypothetical protein